MDFYKPEHESISSRRNMSARDAIAGAIVGGVITGLFFLVKKPPAGGGGGGGGGTGTPPPSGCPDVTVYCKKEKY